MTPTSSSSISLSRDHGPGRPGARAHTARPTPAKSLLTPRDHALILIDHQPQMAFATKTIDIVELRDNITGLAKCSHR